MPYNNLPPGCTPSNLPGNSRYDEMFDNWQDEVFNGLPIEIVELYNKYAYHRDSIDRIIDGYAEDIEFNQPYEVAEAIQEWYEQWKVDSDEEGE